MMNIDYTTAPVRARIEIEATVTNRRRLSDIMLRLTFASESFKGQDAITCADTYMKLILPSPSDPHGTLLRSYTVRSHDTSAGTVDIDFALHGHGGVAAKWAEHAHIGDKARFKGIGGGYTPSAQAPWHLLIGDDSALPAMAAAAQQIGDKSPIVMVVVAADENELLGDCSVLHPSTREQENLDLRVVRNVHDVVSTVDDAFALFEGVPHVFLHGEAGMVRDVRRVLRGAHGVPLKAMSVSGYWRQGVSDEQWRSIKRDWSAQVEREEQELLSAQI